MGLRVGAKSKLAVLLTAALLMVNYTGIFGFTARADSALGATRANALLLTNLSTPVQIGVSNGTHHWAKFTPSKDGPYTIEIKQSNNTTDQVWWSLYTYETAMSATGITTTTIDGEDSDSDDANYADSVVDTGAQGINEIGSSYDTSDTVNLNAGQTYLIFAAIGGVSNVPDYSGNIYISGGTLASSVNDLTVTQSSITTSSAALTWTAPTGATSQRLYYSCYDARAGSWTAMTACTSGMVSALSGSDSSVTVNGLTADTKYRFALYVPDGINSGYSNWVNVTTKAVAPELSALAAAGSVSGSTKVTATATGTDTLAYKVSSSTIAIPNVGDQVIGTTPYTSGSDITGVTPSQYLGVYELDSSSKVVKFKLITLTSAEINNTAPALNATAVAGSVSGSTKVTATATGTDTLAYKVSSSTIPTPYIGDAAADTTSYTSGVDITGVTKSQYIGVYELDSSSKVVKFKLITLTSAEINNTAPELNATAVAGSVSGSTKVTTTASGNDTLAYKVSSSTIATPNVGDQVIGTTPYTSGADITGVTASEYVGVYELDSISKIVKFKLITLTSAEINNTVPVTSATITGTAQVGATLTAQANAGATNVTYQWKKADTATGNYTDIDNATLSTYVPVAGDVGKFIEVVISGDNGSSKSSNATSAVTAANQNQSAPTGLTVTATSNYNAADGKITGVTSDMEYKLSTAPDYTAIASGVTEIDGLVAGTYDVRYASKTGYNASPDSTVTIDHGANQTQNAPTGLTVTATSNYNAADGKITGVTSDMEYKLSTAPDYTAIASGVTEIDGLAAGTYDVRYKAKTGYSASTSAQVTVIAGSQNQSGGSNTPPDKTDHTIGGGSSGSTTPVTAVKITTADTSTSTYNNIIVNVGTVTVTAPASVFSGALGSDSSSWLKLSQDTTPSATQTAVITVAAASNVTPVTMFDVDLTRYYSNGTSEAVHQLSDSATVTISLTDTQIASITDPSKAHLLYYDPSTSKLVDMGATFDLTKKTVTFKTSHFSTFVIAINDTSAPVVSGVDNNGIYNEDKTITFNKGTATLDGAAFTSGDTVSKEGKHSLVVTDTAGNTTTTVFVIDKSSPVVTAKTSKKVNVKNGGISTSDVTVSVSDLFSVTKSVTLNGKACVWPSNGNFSKDGKYVVTVKDQYGQTTETAFTIKKSSGKVNAGVTYSAHIQFIAWQKPVNNGKTAGTTGKSLRLEALKAKLTGNLPKSAAISYQVYVPGKGWITGKNGTIAGTTGKKLRVEAVRITVSGLKGYIVKYKVHVQNKGWDKTWHTTKNGTSVISATVAGKVGSSLRVEAIEIKIVKA